MYPSYVQDNTRKKAFDKFYHEHRYQNPQIQYILALFGIPVDKIPKDQRYFENINYEQFNYILKVLTTNCTATGDVVEIRTFKKTDINRAVKFLDSSCNRYTMLYLADLCANYTPKTLTHNQLCEFITGCPEDKMVSLDLLLYVIPETPATCKGPLALMANSAVLYHYIYDMIFGTSEENVLNWIQMFPLDYEDKHKYLCIDEGKLLSKHKASSYKYQKRRVVSNSKCVFDVAVFLIDRYLRENKFVIIEESDGRGSNGDNVKSKGKEEAAGESSKGDRSSRMSRRKNIPKPVKNQLWRKHFGDKLKGSCYCCKIELDALEGWEAGHIQAAARGGSDKVENLRPICSTCNKSMGTDNMDDFMARYMTMKK
jgi:5-methylcytosine-specific restriction endonuclease McrA